MVDDNWFVFNKLVGYRQKYVAIYLPWISFKFLSNPISTTNSIGRTQQFADSFRKQSQRVKFVLMIVRRFVFYPFVRLPSYCEALIVTWKLMKQYSAIDKLQSTQFKFEWYNAKRNSATMQKKTIQIESTRGKTTRQREKSGENNTNTCISKLFCTVSVGCSLIRFTYMVFNVIRSFSRMAFEHIHTHTLC